VEELVVFALVLILLNLRAFYFGRMTASIKCERP
jgi:hypothetical protein